MLLRNLNYVTHYIVISMVSSILQLKLSSGFRNSNPVSAKGFASRCAPKLWFGDAKRPCSLRLDFDPSAFEVLASRGFEVQRLRLRDSEFKS